ncbi:hypothetical protein ABL840_04760 [Variovorax sp. NFACC27]|jgi:hypothetical protein|uniref:Uncharacterized protein n=1 Tax=Variovorax paradoxus TaxID=34073 RepID=A0A5Q0M063_VARPD|nr:hypothetical protein [Variovorax paradoxus]QFZ81872.1 hypothetical protein GFK26_03345 [Variovorax paradoxus]
MTVTCFKRFSSSTQPALCGLFYVYTMHHSLVFLFSSMTAARQSIGLHPRDLFDVRLAQGHALAAGA